MLARLPVAYLLLMAAFATCVLCLGIQWCIRMPKVTAAVLVVSVGCCLGMLAVGSHQFQHWNARQMLVLYSFTWLGLAIGFFPSRKLLLKLSDDWRRGVRTENFKYPARYQAAVYTSVIIMDFLGFILAT